MKIKIRYKVQNKLENYVDLTPEGYFDSLEEGETYEDDGVPKFNHAEKYLDLPTKILEWTKIEITETNQSHSIRTRYFDKGKSWMSHRIDSDSYEEIIVFSQLNDSATHISRIHKKINDNWEMNYDGVITDLEDGSQSEQRIF